VKINDTLGENDSTLTYNDNLRHITDLTGLRVTSLLSPFMEQMNLGDEFIIPVSHGEGRVLIPDKRTLEAFKSNGQIPLQYLDEEGIPTSKYNGSAEGIAGLTNVDGTVFGMMPHPERSQGLNTFKNISGNKEMPIFESAYKAITKGRTP
jgi:phosphoribosylformylglycinamidine synthase